MNLRSLNGKTEPRILVNNHWVRIPFNPVLSTKNVKELKSTREQVTRESKLVRG